MCKGVNVGTTGMPGWYSPARGEAQNAFVSPPIPIAIGVRLQNTTSKHSISKRCIARNLNICPLPSGKLFPLNNFNQIYLASVLDADVV